MRTGGRADGQDMTLLIVAFAKATKKDAVRAVTQAGFRRRLTTYARCQIPDHSILDVWWSGTRSSSTSGFPLSASCHHCSRPVHSLSYDRRNAILVNFIFVKKHTSNKIDNVQCNIMTRSRYHCCHGTSTVHPLYTFVYLHVTVNNVKPPSVATER